MPTTLTRNIVDASTGNPVSQPGVFQVPFPRLPIGTVSGLTGIQAAYFFWSNPIPSSSPPTSCVFSFKPVEALTSVTIHIQAVDSPWDINTLSPTNQPPATGIDLSYTFTVVAAELCEFDITPIMTAVQAGRPWYGVKMWATTGTHNVYSAEAAPIHGSKFIDYRPFVATSWANSPDTPTGLQPNMSAAGTERIGDPSPTLTWVGPQNGGGVMTNVLGGEPTTFELHQYQVQIANNTGFAGGSILYDTGWIDLLSDMLDTSFDPAGSTFGPFNATSGTQYWWRVRVKGVTTGIVSDWSDLATFEYITPPTVTITGPAPIVSKAASTHDPSPTIQWTYTSPVGETQTYFQVTLTNRYTGEQLFTSGLIQSTDHQYTLPTGYMHFYDGSINTGYKVTVDTLSSLNRIPTPGFHEYFSDYLLLSVIGGSVTDPNTVTVVSQGNLPWVEVKWTYLDSIPDYFVVSMDGRVFAAGSPASMATGAPNEYHAWCFPPNHTVHSWSVVAGFNDAGSSSGNPVVTKEIRHNFSWLVTGDMVKYVMLGNLVPQKEVPGNTTIVEPLSGKPVVITQGVSTERGTITARVADNIVGISAANMLADFYAIRDIYGGKAKLFLYDRIIDVFIYDLVQYEKSYNDDVVYDISFAYIETK